MKKSLIILSLLTLLAISSVSALTDYRSESYKSFAGYSLKAYDEGCPKIEVHPGYWVNQIYVRTSHGFECQFPTSAKSKKATVTEVKTEVKPVVTCETLKSTKRVLRERSVSTNPWTYTTEDFTKEECGTEDFTLICSSWTGTSLSQSRTCVWSLN